MDFGSGGGGFSGRVRSRVLALGGKSGGGGEVTAVVTSAGPTAANGLASAKDFLGVVGGGAPVSE